MNDTQHRAAVTNALNRFADGDLAENARNLLNTLGYRSERALALEPNTADAFIDAYDLQRQLNRDRALTADWVSVDPLFQLRGENLTLTDTDGWLFDPSQTQVDNTIIESYVFLAIRLDGNNYNRTQLSQITREINKLFPMPAMLLFQHGNTLTLSVINRRLGVRDQSRDVLEKVTLIKDINFSDTHRAHIDILFDLALGPLNQTHDVRNFVELHRAWEKTLDTSELNKRFFNELANWYFWAVGQVTFPDDAGEDVEVRNATSVIRLLTRLIFVWFIKEKGLVPNALFNRANLDDMLESLDPQESTYYKAILQNLFFATLNQEMNTAQQPNNRRFRGDGRQHYNITSLYRYKNYFIDPDDALRKFETIPFLNGGLFECLDGPSQEDATRILRVDGFSDRDDNPLSVPNLLFFSEEQTVDLSAAYGTNGRRHKVRGLIHILSSYKFTIAENTPIEEEVALDPELLGKVFENLLAAYNPETEVTARKQTGSYYTPREIVNYMTDESLIAYLKNQIVVHSEAQNIFSVITPPSQLDFTKQADPVQTELGVEAVSLSDEQKSEIEKKLRVLFAYNDKPHRFDEAETKVLIEAIDSLKILDPAVGSGAFPMGVLHRLVFILGKLDPGNDQWRQRQIARVESTIERAEEIDDSTIRESTIRDLEGEIESINEAFERNELDYGRKLYLIENCIYGVDIQPIATQIAKLRFFISLIVDQQIDDSPDNRGVRPLPNLETKFGAANTLIGLDRPLQMQIRNPQIDRKEKELEDVRRRHFTARTPKTKAKYRALDAQIRAEISELLEGIGFPHETTEKIAHWDPYDQNASADFFDSEWMFNVRDGYDVVIGNPPYIQLQKDGGRLGRLYAPCNFDSFTRTGDIYCLFYERANQLSKKGGHVCFVTSNKWMRTAYGKKLRDYFIEHTQPVQLLDMGSGVFDATVDTNILLLQNTLPDARLAFAATTIKSNFDTHTGDIAQYVKDNGVAMELPAEGEPWVILSPTELVLKRKIEDVGKPLKDWDINIYRGIITGCNEAFVINEVEREELIAQDPRSAEIMKPLLRGRDIKRYHVQWAGLYMLATGYDLDVPNDYPAVYNHLQTIGEQIESRETRARRKGLFNRDDQGENWWNLRACAYYPEFEKEKVLYPNMTKFLPFVYDSNGFYTNDKSFIITGENNLKYLTGYFNSRVAAKWIRENCPELQGGTRELRKVFFENISVPSVTEANQHLVAQIETRVDQILAAKRTCPDANICELENEIDQIVYLLYDLTPKEIAIVEEAENV